MNCVSNLDAKWLVRSLAASTVAIVFISSMLRSAQAQVQVGLSADSSPQVVGAGGGIERAAGITSYVQAFFIESNPATALDMLARLPGFTFNGGSTTRGFSGSAGNVLIDGSVAATRSVGLDEILRRIPASNVERIDVIRGGGAGIDMQGFPVVANVIRKSAQITGGAIQIAPAANNNGNYLASGRAEISHRTNHFSFDGALETESNGFGGPGPTAGAGSRVGAGGSPGGGSPGSSSAGGGSAGGSRMLGNGFQSRYNNLGALQDTGRYLQDGYENNYSGNGVAEYRHDFLGTFRFNASATAQKQSRATYYYATNPLGVETINISPSLGSSNEFEFGTDYEGTFGGYTATVLGLYRRNFSVSSSKNISTATETGSKTPNGETIARTTLRKEVTPWLTLQAGAEGALNFRDTKSFLKISGISQNIPNANIRVEERRAEFFGTANLTFWQGFRAEFGMRYETSLISQLGDTNQDRAFTFGKPRAILTYDLTPQTQLRFRVERRIGQLDFSSFAASNDPVLGTVTAGNAGLEPEQAWEYEGAIEHRFWRRGSVSITHLHSNVEKINDRILITTPTAIFDAPGNIGDGTRDRLSLRSVLPFDELGFDNLRLLIDGSWNWSKVTDPVTGVQRGISNEFSFFTSYTLTQDVAAWNSSFGVSGNFEPRRTNYLLRELRQEKGQPRSRIFWTWKPQPDMQVDFSVENVFFKRERTRERTLYMTSRAVADFSGSETLRLVTAPAYLIQLRKTF
jgi:hypothetical protein